MKQKILPIKEKISQHVWQKPDGRKLRVGVGCAYLGKGEGDNLTEREHDLNVLMTTYEKGFRFYDTSADYQGGRSELILGEFFRQVPRDSVFIATKSNFEWRKPGDPFVKFQDNFMRSFEKLQVDHIDLFQIHDTDHFGCCEEKVLPFLMEQQKKGLISYIGMGTRSLNAHELAVRSGLVQSALSYQNYSLLTRAAAPLIERCKQQSCAFINASVLHFGMIKSEDPLSFNPWKAVNAYWRRWQTETLEFQRICRQAGISILAPALQYSLLHPDIDMTLNGIHRLSNIESTIDSMDTIIHPEVWASIQRQQSLNPFCDIQDDLQY